MEILQADLMMPSWLVTAASTMFAVLTGAITWLAIELKKSNDKHSTTHREDKKMLLEIQEKTVESMNKVANVVENNTDNIEKVGDVLNKLHEEILRSKRR